MKELHYRIGNRYDFRRYRIKFNKKGGIEDVGFSRFEKEDYMGNDFNSCPATVALGDLKYYLPEHSDLKDFPEKIREELIRISMAEKI
jgi:hypothetical protein